MGRCHLPNSPHQRYRPSPQTIDQSFLNKANKRLTWHLVSKQPVGWAVRIILFAFKQAAEMLEVRKNRNFIFDPIQDIGLSRHFRASFPDFLPKRVVSVKLSSSKIKIPLCSTHVTFCMSSRATISPLTAMEFPNCPWVIALSKFLSYSQAHEMIS